MADDEIPTTVDINYVKSSDFREVACDGILGGPTPRGKIWLAFFTERLPLPRIVRHGVLPTANPGEVMIDPNIPPAVIDGRSGIIRNIEFGLYLNGPTARELHEWLGKHIEQLEKAEKAQEESL